MRRSWKKFPPERNGEMNNLKRLRKERGLTMMALASQAGTTPTWLTYMERYGHIPGADLRGRIAAALGITEKEIWPDLEEDAHE